ncbi:hypothetical protein BDR06DRAFT_983636 [Suillus hirtellus]|nr:hypothetical protein BDR06DRAFT_983636 [Suillus hirtellus]
MSHCLQNLSQCCPKVILSKEARALLTFQHRQKSKGFKTALNDAWLHIDKTVKTITSSHHKRLCFKHSKSNAWNAFCWKKNQEAKDENAQTSSRKGVLQDLLHNYSNEYCKLSQDEKDHLVEEYKENKLLKSTGIRTSMKSKINDVTQTLKAIRTSLKCHTSTETILYTVQGSTDIPLCGIIFATEGVNDFIASVMNIDDQHLISKMEGFAIQGIQQINHTLHMFKKIQIHQIMLIFALEEIIKIPKAMMQWVNYWHNIVQHYHIICEGWPTHIPLKNLSEASTSLPELQMLHDILLNEDKYQWLLQEHNKKVNTGEIGKKCIRPMEEPSIPHHKKIYKSLDTIESSTLAPSPSVPSPSSVQPSVSTLAPSPSPPSVQPSMSTLAPLPSPPSAQPSMSTLAPSSSSPSASTLAPSTSTASAST